MKQTLRKNNYQGRHLKVFLILGFSFGGASGNPNDVSFQTNDGIRIAATVAKPIDADEKRAAVIFIHQGGSSKEEWTSLPLFEQVVGEGMFAIAYDVRGHGDSGGEADFSTLFDDPRQSPQDLAAVIEWLRQTGEVDMLRVAIVGASIGANLACVGAGSRQFSVKTAVAISAKVSAVYNLAGGQDQIDELRSVFFIASELEQDGQRATWASELYDSAADPRQLEIIAASTAHGVSIFDDDPNLPARILDWLLRTL